MNALALVVGVLALIIGSISIYLQSTPDASVPPSDTQTFEQPSGNTDEMTGLDTSGPVSRSGSAVIDLNGQGLTETPVYVFEKTNTEVLDLSHNDLDGALQAEVRHLSKLKVLDLSHNRFTGVPAEVGQLQALEVLDLSYNELTGLPHELGNLKNLQELDLRGNDYSAYDLDIIRQSLPETTTIRTE